MILNSKIDDETARKIFSMLKYFWENALLDESSFMLLNKDIEAMGILVEDDD